MVALAALALGACQETAADELDNAVDTICRCSAFLPDQQQACVTELEGDAGEIDAACEACVEEHAADCTGLLVTCESACTQNDPPGENSVTKVFQEGR